MNDDAVACGALKSPEDLSDRIFEHLARADDCMYLSEFPQEFDLRQYARPARNQGGRGTCAAFAAAAIKEICENREFGFNEWISPEFIYYHRENKPSSGMYGRDVFRVLHTIGSVPESAYPYSKSDDYIGPNQELYEMAAQYRIINFSRITTINGLKRALLELGPCYFQLPLYKTRPHFWRSYDNELCSGGHAVAVVGYNQEGFILKNSWGTAWGDHGCIIFPYEDWALHWECWVSVDEKNNIAPVVGRINRKKLANKEIRTLGYKKVVRNKKLTKNKSWSTPVPIPSTTSKKAARLSWDSTMVKRKSPNTCIIA